MHMFCVPDGQQPSSDRSSLFYTNAISYVNMHIFYVPDGQQPSNVRSSLFYKNAISYVNMHVFDAPDGQQPRHAQTPQVSRPPRCHDPNDAPDGVLKVQINEPDGVFLCKYAHMLCSGWPATPLRGPPSNPATTGAMMLQKTYV